MQDEELIDLDDGEGKGGSWTPEDIWRSDSDDDNAWKMGPGRLDDTIGGRNECRAGLPDPSFRGPLQIIFSEAPVRVGFQGSHCGQEPHPRKTFAQDWSAERLTNTSGWSCSQSTHVCTLPSYQFQASWGWSGESREIVNCVPVHRHVVYICASAQLARITLLKKCSQRYETGLHDYEALICRCWIVVCS